MSRIEDSLNKFRELLESSNKPVLFFDSDADGGTSYLQLKNRFPKLVGFPVTKSEDSQSKVLERVDFNPDLVLFFDTPLVHEFMFERFKDKNIVLIDHHPKVDEFANGLLEKYNVFYVNPLDFNEKDSRPSCYWAYLISGMKENLGYVAIGSVTDFYVLDVLRELYDYDSKLFNLIFNLTDEKREELFDFISKNGYTDEFSYAKRIDWVQYLIFETPLRKFRLLFDFLYKLEYDDILKGISIIKNTSLYDLLCELDIGKGFLFEDISSMTKKLNRLLKKYFKEYKEEEFVEVEHKGNTSFNRHIVDELLYKFKSCKIIVSTYFKEGSDYVSFSFRGKESYTVNDVIAKALEGLNGKGGGHPYGSGTALNKSDLDEFQIRYRKLINDKLKN